MAEGDAEHISNEEMRQKLRQHGWHSNNWEGSSAEYWVFNPAGQWMTLAAAWRAMQFQETYRALHESEVPSHEDQQAAAEAIEDLTAAIDGEGPFDYETRALMALRRSWQLTDPSCQALALADAQVYATLHLARMTMRSHEEA